VIRALIFDLDQCLYETREVGEDFFRPVFEAIGQANQGTLAPNALSAAFEDIWRLSYDWVAAHHRFSPAMTAAGWEAYRRLHVRGALRGYGDQSILTEIPLPKFLVTTGFRRLQESKVAALGIEPLFEAVVVDAIDEAGRRAKQGWFEQILSDHQWTGREVMVIGDNADSEIAAGNALGMVTVQTLRPQVPYATNATHHIGGLNELPDIIYAEC
jgi:putative hydrolase of the HAD superfamily